MNKHYELAKPKQPEYTPPDPIDVPNPDQEEDLPNQEPIDVPLDDDIDKPTKIHFSYKVPEKDM